MFTYDPRLISPVDRIRFAVGDTDPLAPLRQDESIDALVLLHGETLATAKVARSIASEFARQPSNLTIPGGPGISYASRVTSLQDLAKSIEGGASGATAGPAVDAVLDRGWDAGESEYTARDRFDGYYE
jgi:hypothetical protein